MLAAKREQISTLRSVLKANKNTAEVALAPPGDFGHTAPADRATDVAVDATLEWDAADGAAEKHEQDDEEGPVSLMACAQKHECDFLVTYINQNATHDRASPQPQQESSE